MLGFIGFSIAAILVGLFAFSFNRYFQTLSFHTRHTFVSAFILLALALFVWGFAPLINIPSVTTALVFAGDALLILGTGYLISAQLKMPSLWLLVVAVVGVAILTLRAFVFQPAAFVQDGILHFNLEGEARLVILAILAFIWMPLGIRVTQLAVRSKGAVQFSGLIALVFIAALIFAALFIAARQTEIIIASFAALAFSFLVLALLPWLINRVKHKLHRIDKAPRQKEELSHGK